MTIVQTGRLTATETGHRNQISASMPSDGTQLGVVQGVQSGLVLTKTSGMGWQLDLGRCTISPATPANGGVVATVTVAETGTFANGDATRDRIDVVGLQIDETATIGNGNPAVKSVIIQGAYPVSGQPVTPTIPAGTIGLWSVRINANTSAGSGGWNTANLVDIRQNPRQHAEWTFSNTGIPSATVWGVGTVTLDAANSTDTAFTSTPGSDRITIRDAGIYAITLYGAWGTATTARGFSQIQLPDGVTSFRYSAAVGENIVVSALPNLRCAAGTVLTLATYLTCSGTTTWAGRVRITKIG